jgi:hypothetical protein
MLSIVLQPYNRVFSLPKDYILTSLPESLFAAALQEDPSASELVIPHLDVTPEAMDVIVNYAQGIEPLHHDPDLILAYRYLNIPWLLYYTDPLYDLIPNRMTITDPRNREVWWKAIWGDHDLIVGYYLAKGWVPTDEDFTNAARGGSVKIIKLLLGDARVNPAATYNNAIQQATSRGHLEVVRLLLGDERVNPAARNNLALLWAVSGDYPEIVRLLKTDPRVQAMGGY